MQRKLNPRFMPSPLNHRLLPLAQRTSAPHHASIGPNASASGRTQLRLRLQIPPTYQQEPIISRLISHHGLVVNITAAFTGESLQSVGYFDVELRGTPQQIQNGLAYLKSLTIAIVGKPNPDGDDWHY